MASSPSIAIFVSAGDAYPAVLSTAASKYEQVALDAWLVANPELHELVKTAWRLAESPHAFAGEGAA